MDALFAQKVRSAAVAGWWTLLIGAGVLLFQWIAYLVLMSARPPWILWLWGTGLGWDTVQTVWLYFAAVYKLCLGLMALAVIWLTIWARQLRSMRD